MIVIAFGVYVKAFFQVYCRNLSMQISHLEFSAPDCDIFSSSESQQHLVSGARLLGYKLTSAVAN
jgi:hypothetical protein